MPHMSVSKQNPSTRSPTASQLRVHYGAPPRCYAWRSALHEKPQYDLIGTKSLSLDLVAVVVAKVMNSFARRAALGQDPDAGRLVKNTLSCQIQSTVLVKTGEEVLREHGDWVSSEREHVV